MRPRLDTTISSAPSGDQVGREVVVEAAVVVAGQAAVLVLRDPHRRPAQSKAGRSGRVGDHVGGEDVPAAFVRGGDEGETPPVRRPARVDVHGAVRDEGRGGARLDVEDAQLHGVGAVRHVRHMTSVRRPVGLMVVAGTIRELPRLVGPQPLPPEGALHRVDELRAVGRPGGGAGPRRHLGHVHLAPIIRMGNADLLQDGLAHGRRGSGPAGGEATRRRRGEHELDMCASAMRGLEPHA